MKRKKEKAKRTPRDNHLHINRGSPYQKQRGLCSQPSSSGTGRGLAWGLGVGRARQGDEVKEGR